MPGGVRARVTIGTTAVLAAVLIAASYGTIAFFRASLSDNLEATIGLRAGDLEASLRGGAEPAVLTASDDEVAFVQIVDAQGRVVAASPRAAGLAPVATQRPTVGRPLTVEKRLPLDDDPYRIQLRHVDTPDGPVTLLVAGSLEDVAEGVALLGRLAAVAVPLLVAIVATATWVAVGRAFRPVEAIRAEVAEIQAGQLGRRVPEPRTGDEVERLARTMNGMLSRIEAAYAAQEQFVADAAHELRSPLASLRTQLEVARSTSTLDHPALLEDLLAEVERLQRLADGLLLLAKREAGGPPAQRGVVLDFDDIVLDEVRRLPRRPDVRVDCGAVSAAAVRGDADDLGRVVVNLLSNANRHARTLIALGLAEHAGRVVLTIADDGEGIPADQIERIFDRFIQADPARSSEGAGLGLSIARAIVEDHGGTITAGGRADGGAVFRVELPAASA
ncbi:MAG: sensor histidine kinase [Dehalococcoidia bacterium]